MKSGMVLIVIKAPNQMIDDQTVECDRLWTVSQLKEHLCKEYPTHPKPENQKLIYSGKLLSDHMPLTDVLKTYGGHEYNTIHLVCSVRENSSRVTPIISPSLKSAGPAAYTALPTNPLTPSLSSVDGTTAEDTNGTVRRRTVNTCIFGHAVPRYGVHYVYPQQDIAQQMLLIQQAYLQYMTNYIQTANNGRNRLDLQHPEPTNNEPINREMPENQVEPEVEDDGAAQRDWLEWIYIMTRLVVLFSVVYFYSSPLRFIVVMTMALLLFNMDVERWRRRHDEVPDNPQVRDNNGGDGPSVDTQQAAEVRHQMGEGAHLHPLHIVSTFVTSFFLSLIPEQRAI